MKKNIQIGIGCIFYIVFLINSQTQAQSGSGGNTYIFSGQETEIYGAHSFASGGSGVQPGIVGTDRPAAQGFLSFMAGSSWTGATDAAHVDGYVKTYLTGAFTFPIGDNAKYRPAAVSASAFADPTDAAYYGIDGTTAITTSLKGGNEPVLPSGGPFATTSKGTGVTAVDSKEYWDINGTTAAKITLTWDATSDVTTLTTSTLANLMIVGWDGTKWVEIPSTVDATALLGGSSSLTAGSITTNTTVVPNTYNVYTLGSKAAPACLAGTVAPALVKN